MAKSLTYSARGAERSGDLAVVSERRPPPPPALNTNYGLRDFLTLLFKEKRLILLVVLGTVSLAVFVSFVPSVKYTATTRMLVMLSREYMFRPQVGNDNGQSVSLDNPHIIRSEIEILSNPQLKRQVVTKFGPERMYPFLTLKEDTEKNRREQIEGAVKNLAANMKIEPVKDSNVVRVSFGHPDPQLAADVLNTMIQTYLDSRREIYGQGGSGFLVGPA